MHSISWEILLMKSASDSSAFIRKLLEETEQKSSENKTTNFASRFSELHSSGLAVVHMLRNVNSLTDRWDDRRIINNLREDGGTESKPEGYQLYPIISATIVPPSKYPIAQQLYTTLGKYFFVGIDPEKTRLINYSHVDANTVYSQKNSKGRNTYKAAGIDNKIDAPTQEERITALGNLNEKIALRATKPSTSKLFGTSPPSLFCSMNELTTKINASSMLCIGVIASTVENEPVKILELLDMQKQLQENTGVIYPIYIYNNSHDSITLDFVDSNPTTFDTNQFTQINSEALLKQMEKKFPNGISGNCFTSYLFGDKAQQSTILIDDFKKTLTAKDKKNEFNAEVKKAIDLLKKLPPYTKEDNVVVIHKQGKANAHKDDHYEEINQAALKKFVTQVLGVNEEENAKFLLKAYNIQFRLGVYSELLNTNQSIVNYSNLEEDLTWSNKVVLTERAHTI